MPRVDVFVANRSEAARLCGRESFVAGRDAEAVVELAAVVASPVVVVKRGAHGSTLRVDGRTHAVPAVDPQQVFDVQGAGDTYLAGLVAGRCRGLDWPDACLLASAAAGVAVGRPGTAVVSRADAAKALKSLVTPPAGTVVTPDEAAAHALRLRRFGLRVGLTGGCFDVGFHAGHLGLIGFAASRCDFLFVGVDSDARVAALKGAHRPCVPADQRVGAVAALRGVGAAFVFETHPRHVVELLEPDVYVKGGDYAGKEVPEAGRLAEWGGEFLLAPLVDCESTTDRVDRIKRNKIVEEIS